MADLRVAKLAEVMVNYSPELKPGEKFWLRTTPLAHELSANGASAQNTVSSGLAKTCSSMKRSAAPFTWLLAPVSPSVAAKTNRACTGWDMLCDMAESEISWMVTCSIGMEKL